MRFPEPNHSWWATQMKHAQEAQQQQTDRAGRTDAGAVKCKAADSPSR